MKWNEMIDGIRWSCYGAWERVRAEPGGLHDGRSWPVRCFLPLRQRIPDVGTVRRRSALPRNGQHLRRAAARRLRRTGDAAAAARIGSLSPPQRTLPSQRILRSVLLLSCWHPSPGHLSRRIGLRYESMIIITSNRIVSRALSWLRFSVRWTFLFVGITFLNAYCVRKTTFRKNSQQKFI